MLWGFLQRVVYSPLCSITFWEVQVFKLSSFKSSKISRRDQECPRSITGYQFSNIGLHLMAYLSTYFVLGSFPSGSYFHSGIKLPTNWNSHRYLMAISVLAGAGLTYELWFKNNGWYLPVMMAITNIGVPSGYPQSSTTVVIQFGTLPRLF